MSTAGPDPGLQQSLPLQQAILRNLGDRSYDKRKNAALDIENLIKQLQENNDTNRIRDVITVLGKDFACSTNANHRKGGLIGLAATAIGLMTEANTHLDQVLGSDMIACVWRILIEWMCLLAPS
jgi:vacuole morphology and inheritance protein 14